MKRPKFTILIFAVLFFITSASFAQNVSTQGTDFWVSFMTNGHKRHPGAPNDGNWILTQLLFSGKRDCSGTITNPQTGWSTNFTVNANTITTVEIPENQAYIDGTSEQVQNKGLQIVTDDTVSVFCSNIAHLSFDASYVLPLQSLADEYIIQTYDQSNSPGQPYQKQNQTSAFLVVATEDNTVIDIIPTVKTLNGHEAGQTITVNLDKGQTYQVRSDNTQENNQRDLSGTKVTARDNKLIAVFNGNTLTAVPRNGSSFDHVFEQAMPVQSWGRKFVATCSIDREKDYVKVTSASNNNTVLKNGQVLTNLQANESYTFELPSQEHSCFIETSGPAAVYLYNITRGGNNIGDPSVVWIAPIEQRIDEITFTTFHNATYADIDNHYVNIIVSNDDIGTVLMDGSPIPANQFESVNGSNLYSFTRQSIQHGVHNLKCFGGFNAHVYGFGNAKGYAYMVGSKAIDLSTRVTMNETFVPKQGTYEYCPEATITFEAETNLDNASLQWDFGDGTTSTQNPVDHTYAEKRIYEVVLTATAKGNEAKSSEVSHYFVDTRTKTIIDYDELCKGDLYTGHGFNVTITNDTVLGTEIENAVHPICKDSLFVYITALPGYYAAYNETLCWQGEPMVYNEHGFNITIDHPDTYTDQIYASIPGGCDSIIDLTLTVTDRIVNPNPIEYSGCAESFTWNGITYTQSGDYEQVFTSSMGCDSIIQLHVFLNEVLEGDTDTVSGICNTYQWHGHLYDQSGSYTDTIPSVLGCDSIVHLDLTLDYSPSPKIKCTSSNVIVFGDTIAVITNTEFFSFQYNFYITDTLGHISDWDTCEWYISKPSWIIEPYTNDDEPDKRFCRVYVAEHSDNLVELKATVLGCDTVSTTFYLKSSFFDIEEQNAEQPNFSIVPNPNNGKMDFHLSHMTGKVCIRVYDMKGVLLDQIWVNNPIETDILQYDLKHHAAGIYYIIATAKEGTLTQKMVVLE